MTRGGSKQIGEGGKIEKGGKTRNKSNWLMKNANEPRGRSAAKGEGRTINKQKATRKRGQERRRANKLGGETTQPNFDGEIKMHTEVVENSGQRDADDQNKKGGNREKSRTEG